MKEYHIINEVKEYHIIDGLIKEATKDNDDEAQEEKDQNEEKNVEMLKQSSSRVQLKNFMLKNIQTLMTTNSLKKEKQKNLLALTC